ncbi:MAG: ArdC-like ssDNA-binding domain-containing protein, partial [Actinomycetota bacterium]|nr:ArdC-like ssDNA-binding domain-containing protein [Actinomycetota bacterium]
MGESRPGGEVAARVRAAKVAAAQETLQAEIARITTGEDWRRFLRVQARLHHYSANNVQLIWAQHAQAHAEGRVPAPEPTYVAGFTTWKTLGRSVERGQRGYAVLAPVRGTRRTGVDAMGERRHLEAGEEPVPTEVVESTRMIRGFTLAHVFDVSQTSGPPLPEPPSPTLLAGEAPRGLGVAVAELVESRGYTVDTVPDAAHIGGANGQTHWGTRSVVVRSDMDDAAMVKTLIHEAGHVLLHAEDPGRSLARGLKEVEAESVAFVVAAVHGMPTDEYSFPYVAAWAGDQGAGAVAAT